LFIKFTGVNFEDSNKDFEKELLFWVITQRVVIVSYGRFGTIYRTHLQVSRILNIKLMGSSKTAVRNYHYSLPNNPQECSSHLLRGGSQKSRKNFYKSRLFMRRKTLPFTQCITSWHSRKNDVTLSLILHIENLKSSRKREIIIIIIIIIKYKSPSCGTLYVL
jgi:hypothetical protein